MAAPNAELAYKVLDQIDAHPEQWKQDQWVGDCGTSYCFAGWALTLTGHKLSLLDIDGLRRMELDGRAGVYGVDVQAAAATELGLVGYLGSDDAEILFESGNTRDDLGDLVAEIFGPRPAGDS